MASKLKIKLIENGVERACNDVSLWAYNNSIASDPQGCAANWLSVALDDAVVWTRDSGAEFPTIYCCDHCGCEFMLAHDAIRYRCNFYCKNCYDALPRCADCGEIINFDYGRLVKRADGKIVEVCEPCSDNYVQCRHCGCLFAPSQVDENGMCASCAPLLITCAVCGKKGFADDCGEFDKVGAERYVCRHCNPPINGYHYARRKNTFAHKNTPKDKLRALDERIGCGFELEVEPRRGSGIDEYPNATIRDGIHNKFMQYDDVVLERDSSLDSYGFEIISQPHTFAALRALPIEDLLLHLKNNGYRSHDGGNCGLHLHVSRTAFGKTRTLQEYNIAKLLYFFDYHWDDIVKVSRRDSDHLGYCEPIDIDSIGYHLSGNKQDKAAKLAKEGLNSRYFAINLENSATLEYRIMRGTLTPSTFKACIDFLLVLSRRVKKVKYSDVANVELWLQGIDENTIRYLRERGAFLDCLDKIKAKKDNWKVERGGALPVRR